MKRVFVFFIALVIVLTLVSICDRAEGAVVVRDRALFHQGGGTTLNRMTGIPREHLQCFPDNTLLAFAASYSWRSSVKKYNLLDGTLTDTLAYSVTQNISNHMHMTGDSIWSVVMGRVTDGPNPVFWVDHRDLSIDTTYIDRGTEYNWIGMLARFKHDISDLFCASRATGGNAMNGEYATSNDSGVTWQWQGDYYPYNHDIRIDFDYNPATNTPVGFLYLRGTSTKYYYCHTYDTTTQQWTRTEIASGDYFERRYSAVVTNNGDLHIAWSDSAQAGQVSRVYHSYSTDNGATWTQDVVFTSAYHVGGGWEMLTAMAYTGYDDKVWLAYTTPDVSGDITNHRAYAVVWDGSTESWSTPVEITQGTNADRLVGPLNVPKECGAVVPFAFDEIVGGNHQITIVILENEGSVPAEDANADILIESIPYTLTQAMHTDEYNNSGGTDIDTVMIAGDKLVSTGEGLTVRPSTTTPGNPCTGFYFYFVGDTLLAGNEKSLTGRGITVLSFGSAGTANGCINMTVEGATLLQRTPNIDTLNYTVADTITSRCNGVTARYLADGIVLKDCFIEVNAYSSQAVALAGVGNHVIQNCTISNRGPGFLNRCQFEASGVYGDAFEISTIDTSAGEWHVQILNNFIDAPPHNGVYLAGNANDVVHAEIRGNRIRGDSRNIMWGIGDGGGTCNGRANDYGIQITRGANCMIVHDSIVADENSLRGGTRGIQLVGCEGFDYGNIVCSNYVDVHEAGDVQFRSPNGYYPCAIKVRQDNVHVDVFDNYFKYTADGSVPWGTITGGYYPAGEAGMYEQWTTNSPPFYVRWRNNTFIVEDRNPTGGAEITAFKFDNNTQGNDPSSYNEGNVYITDYVGVTFGGYDGSAEYSRLYSDTIKLVAGKNSNLYSYWFGLHWLNNLSYAVANQLAVNMHYLDGSDNMQDYDTPTYIHFEADVDDDQSITLQSVVTVTVVNSVSQPVDGASVTIINNYGQTVSTGTTNSWGIYYSDSLSYAYYDYNLPDSTNFSPLTITAAKAGYQSQETMTLGWRSVNKEIEVQLDLFIEPKTWNMKINR